MELEIIKLLFYCLIGAIFIYAVPVSIFLYKKTDTGKKEEPLTSLLASEIRRKTGM